MKKAAHLIRVVILVLFIGAFVIAGLIGLGQAAYSSFQQEPTPSQYWEGQGEDPSAACDTGPYAVPC
jgi:hypothetical protein